MLCAHTSDAHVHSHAVGVDTQSAMHIRCTLPPTLFCKSCIPPFGDAAAAELEPSSKHGPKYFLDLQSYEMYIT